MQYTVEIFHDEHAESPLEYYEGLEFVSFNRKHANFKHPDDVQMPTAQERKHNRAFVVACYQHGMVQWALPEHVQQCPWDTCMQAGVLRLPTSIPKAVRYEYATKWLEAYTNYCNGAVYGFSVVDSKGNEIGNECGWNGIDVPEMIAHIKDLCGKDANIQYTGSAADLAA